MAHHDSFLIVGHGFPDGRWACSRCMAFLYSFENCFNAFGDEIGMLPIAKQLVRYCYDHMYLVPLRWRVGVDFPERLWKPIIDGAGIDLQAAKFALKHTRGSVNPR